MSTIKHQTVNLLKQYKTVLSLDKIANGTIRSYLSDTRHFLSWLTHVSVHGPTKATPLPSDAPSEVSARGRLKGISDSLNLIRRKTVDRYYEYLVENQIPRSTINRRLSSLRKFGLFCVEQGWLPDNYFAYLKNIARNETAPEDTYHLNAYRQVLLARETSPQTVKNYLSDIRHFINWNGTNQLDKLD